MKFSGNNKLSCGRSYKYASIASFFLGSAMSRSFESVRIVSAAMKRNRGPGNQLQFHSHPSLRLTFADDRVDDAQGRRPWEAPHKQLLVPSFNEIARYYQLGPVFACDSPRMSTSLNSPASSFSLPLITPSNTPLSTLSPGPSLT